MTDRLIPLSPLTGHEIVDDHAEAQELLRRRDLDMPPVDADACPFVDGTLLFLNGQAHKDRRALLLPLFDADHVARHELERLPSIAAAAIGAAGPGVVDLVDLSENVFWQITAEIIGLDDVTDAEAAHVLRRVLHPMILVQSIHWYTGDRAALLRTAHAARAELEATLVRPALERRRSRTDAPDDVISRMVEADWDDESIVREAIAFLVAGTVNNTSRLIFTLEHVLAWAGDDPARQAELRSPAFVKAAVEETLRLKGSTGMFRRRRTTTEVTLSGGRRFDAGVALAVDAVAASRDEAVYGSDPDAFDPHRAERLPRASRPYGLAFGAGPHLCIGLPMAVGHASGDSPCIGLIPRLLHLLLDAGIELVADPPPTREEAVGDRYATFPVRFTGR